MMPTKKLFKFSNKMDPDQREKFDEIVDAIEASLKHVARTHHICVEVDFDESVVKKILRRYKRKGFNIVEGNHHEKEMCFYIYRTKKKECGYKK